MATLKQIEASRRNGAKSKGPVTAEGKARVAQNGIKHGIYSQLVVLQNEERSLYEESRDTHLAEWEPATETEHSLVMDIVDARWRLRRLSALETAALDFELDRMRPEIAETFQQIDEPTRTMLGFNSLLSLNGTYASVQTSVRTQHRIIDRAISQLLRLGKLRRPADPPVDDSDDTGGGVSHGVQPASESAPASSEDLASAEVSKFAEQTRAAHIGAPETTDAVTSKSAEQTPESMPAPAPVPSASPETSGAVARIASTLVLDRTLGCPGRGPGIRCAAAA